MEDFQQQLRLILVLDSKLFRLRSCCHFLLWTQYQEIYISTPWTILGMLLKDNRNDICNFPPTHPVYMLGICPCVTLVTLFVTLVTLWPAQVGDTIFASMAWHCVTQALSHTAIKYSAHSHSADIRHSFVNGRKVFRISNYYFLIRR